MPSSLFYFIIIIGINNKLYIFIIMLDCTFYIFYNSQ